MSIVSSFMLTYNNHRIPWIDWCKAILISLVILGHSGSVFTYILYLFHIPAFFFISGYLANYEKKGQGTIKSSKWMILSILLYNIIFILLNILTSIFFSKDLRSGPVEISINEIILRPFIGIFACCYDNNPWTKPLVGQFWFVWVLILMKLIFHYIRNLKISSLIKIVLICILYIGIINYFNVKTLFYIDRVICAFPFFIIGQICRNEDTLLRRYLMNANLKLCSIYFLVFCGCFTWYWLTKSDHHPDLYHLTIGKSVIVYYIAAFTGTSLLIRFSKYLPQSKIITHISNGTFLILAIHMLMLCYIPRLEPVGIFPLILILLILYPLILLSERYMPILLGKRQNSNKK